MLAFQVPLKPSLKQCMWLTQPVTCICFGIWTEGSDPFCGSGKVWSTRALWEVTLEAMAACSCQCGDGWDSHADAVVVLWVVIQSIWAWFSIPPSDSVSCSITFQYISTSVIQLMACNSKCSWPALCYICPCNLFFVELFMRLLC